jgi:hypothetical protein
MLCKICGKYHPVLEPCYADPPHDIIVHYTAEQLARASDEQIVNELRRRSIIALPHPNPDSPDYSLPVLTSKYLSDPRRSAWRKHCLALLAQSEPVKVAV